MTTPENTSRRDPLLHLVGSFSGDPSDYITDMEAAGQRQLVHSDVLPTEAPWSDRGHLGLRAPGNGPTLEDLGFTKGDPVDGDPLFVRCTLPEGWTRTGTEHPMWSSIADERGVERVSVFYKAAFYDRAAHASIVNVGASVATAVIYGDGPATLPAVWDRLTAAERAAALTQARGYIAEAAESATVRPERVARAESLLAAAREHAALRVLARYGNLLAAAHDRGELTSVEVHRRGLAAAQRLLRR